MAQRAGPTAAFPGLVCAVALRASDRLAIVEGTRLRAPPARVDRVVIFGDTGCRLNGGTNQNCADPAAWPFARVAALAAARHPDLVIHLGDYFYREQACPRRAVGCAGSPWGDRWAAWKADLFDPAAPLLAAAPWVFARGNHEACGRAAAGWFRLLDAASRPPACPAASATFLASVGGLRLLVVDSSDSDDLFAPSALVRAYAARLAPLAKARGPGPGGPPVWIVTHRPVWSATRFADLAIDGLVNATERRAARDQDLSAAALILSGHLHAFASLDFGAARPSQLVAGTGGDLLETKGQAPPALSAAGIDGLPAQVFTMSRFGYFEFDRRGADWIGQFRDLDDRVAAVCRLAGRALTCQSP